MEELRRDIKELNEAWRIIDLLAYRLLDAAGGKIEINADELEMFNRVHAKTEIHFNPPDRSLQRSEWVYRITLVRNYQDE